MGLFKGPRQVSFPLLSERFNRGAHLAVDHFQIRRELLFLLAHRRAIGKSAGRSGGGGSLALRDRGSVGTFPPAIIGNHAHLATGKAVPHGAGITLAIIIIRLPTPDHLPRHIGVKRHRPASTVIHKHALGHHLPGDIGHSEGRKARGGPFLIGDPRLHRTLIPLIGVGGGGGIRLTALGALNK